MAEIARRKLDIHANITQVRLDKGFAMSSLDLTRFDCRRWLKHHTTLITSLLAMEHQEKVFAFSTVIIMNPISKRDDNQYVEFKIAQKALNKEMMAKDCSVACKESNLFWIQ